MNMGLKHLWTWGWIVLALGLPACLPLQQGWQPRVCRSRSADPSTTRYFNQSRAAIFYKLRARVVEGGYDMDSHDFEGGYIRASRKEDLCHPVDPWTASSPDDSSSSASSSCDLDWPVYHAEAVQILINETTSGATAVTINLSNTYRFAKNGTVSEASDTCPEDYDDYWSRISAP